MEVVGELAVQAAPGAAWTVRMTSRIIGAKPLTIW